MISVEKIKVSIVMPAYNAEKYIEKSINSVLEQTYSNWELLIVNDCSTDSTLSIIKSYESRDDRIKVINLGKNKGVAMARNTAIKVSKGEYIAFLDSDDYWTTNKLFEQVRFMSKNNYQFTYSNFYVVNEDDKIIDDRTSPEELRLQDLLKSNHMGCLTVMVEKNIIEKHLMKDLGHEDYLTWLSILSTGISAFNTNKILGYYRVSQNSLSGSKTKAASWQWNIYRNELNLSLLSSLYYFSFYVYKGFKKNLSTRL